MEDSDLTRHVLICVAIGIALAAGKFARIDRSTDRYIEEKGLDNLEASAEAGEHLPPHHILVDMMAGTWGGSFDGAELTVVLEEGTCQVFVECDGKSDFARGRWFVNSGSLWLHIDETTDEDVLAPGQCRYHIEQFEKRDAGHRLHLRKGRGEAVVGFDGGALELR